MCLSTVVFKHLSELYIFLLFGQQFFFLNTVDASLKLLLCLYDNSNYQILGELYE